MPSDSSLPQNIFLLDLISCQVISCYFHAGRTHTAPTSPYIRSQFPFSMKIRLPRSMPSISPSHLPQKISTQTIPIPRPRPIPRNRFLLGRSLAFCVSRVLDCSPTNGLSSCHEREVRPYFYLQHQDNVHRRRLLLIDYQYTTSCFHAAQLACCE